MRSSIRETCEQIITNRNGRETNFLQTELNILKEENDATRDKINELQSWIDSGNQVLGNVSVSQGTQK